MRACAAHDTLRYTQETPKKHPKTHTAKPTGEVTGAAEEAGGVDVARSQTIDGQLVPSQHPDLCLCLCVCARERAGAAGKDREVISRRSLLSLPPCNRSGGPALENADGW